MVMLSLLLELPGQKTNSHLKSFQRCSQAPNLKTLFCSTHKTKNSVFMPETVYQPTLKDSLSPNLTQNNFPHNGEFRPFSVALLAVCVRL